MFWWDTDCGNEQLCARIDDDARKLVKFSFGVIVAFGRFGLENGWFVELGLKSGFCLLCLTGRTSDLGKQQINTKWCVLICEVGLELCNLLAEHIWCISYSSNNTQTSGIGDCCSEFWSSGNIHTSQ